MLKIDTKIRISASKNKINFAFARAYKVLNDFKDLKVSGVFREKPIKMQNNRINMMLCRGKYIPLQISAAAYRPQYVCVAEDSHLYL